MDSDAVDSIMRGQSFKSAKNFSWKKVITKLESYTPTLLNTLESVVKIKTKRSNNDAIIVVCFSIFFKHRYQNMNIVQKIVSLILDTGHSTKQVSYRE